MIAAKRLVLFFLVLAAVGMFAQAAHVFYATLCANPYPQPTFHLGRSVRCEWMPYVDPLMIAAAIAAAAWGWYAASFPPECEV